MQPGLAGIFRGSGFFNGQIEGVGARDGRKETRYESGDGLGVFITKSSDPRQKVSADRIVYALIATHTKIAAFHAKNPFRASMIGEF